MSDLNTWIGVGRLGQDVQVPQGNGPCRFSLAVNRRVKKGDQWSEEASWIDIEYWHKSIIPHLTKGKQIGIRGELRQEKWEDRTTGAARSKIIIVAQDIQLLGESRKEGPGSMQNDPGYTNSGQVQNASTAGLQPRNSTVPKDDFTDDIPF